jgi:4'-phosphopantetheinyl transferase
MDVFWFEQRQADVPLTDEWLSVRELERLYLLKVPKRRTDWRLGRWTAKQAVANLLGIPDLASIEIVAEPSGAPFVVLPNDITGLTISLTHRAGVGACAVAEHGVVGCDLELVEPRSEAFLQDYFTQDELALIARAGIDPVKAATIVWSAKESALKAVREGLRRDTRSVSVVQIDTGDTSTWNHLQVRCESGEVFEGWWCEADTLIRTLVAAPAPAVPIPLEIVFEALV